MLKLYYTWIARSVPSCWCSGDASRQVIRNSGIADVGWSGPCFPQERISTICTMWILRYYTKGKYDYKCKFSMTRINSLRLRPNGRHLADNILKCIFFNENVWISIKIWLKFVPKDPINNIPALVQIMAWHRPGAKPLSEPMMVSLLMHIFVTGPQWVNQTLVPIFKKHGSVQGMNWRLPACLSNVSWIQHANQELIIYCYNI